MKTDALTLTLDVGEWLASSYCHLIQKKRAPIPNGEEIRWAPNIHSLGAKRSFLSSWI
jgi:hypothetical protein